MADLGQTVSTCVLQKNEGEASFGFGVSQQVGKPHIIIKSVKENSPASRGGLKEGYLILAVENESVYDKNVKAVGEIIARAQDGKLMVAFTRGEGENKENAPAAADLSSSTTISASTPPQPQARHLSVHRLRKWQNYPGFGFSIQQRQDGSKIIVKVEPNTPAFASGLKQTAILCKVNATNVRAISYQETVKLIKESGSEVSVAVTSADTFRWLTTNGKDLQDLDVVEHEPPPEPPASEAPPPDVALLTATTIASASVKTTESTEDSYRPVTSFLTETQTVQTESTVPVNSLPPEATVVVTETLPVPKPEAPQFVLYRCHVTRTPEIKGYGFGLKYEVGENDLPGYLRLLKIEPNSPAYQSGLESGMVVMAINGTFVFNKTVADVRPLVAAQPNDVDFIVATQDTFLQAAKAYGADIVTAAESFEVQSRERKLAEDSTATVFSATISATATLPPTSLPVTTTDNTSPPVTAMPEEPAPVTWPADLPVPRNCHLVKWPTKFKGYGFHLQAERNRQGHYIGKLDSGSPAELGGLAVNWRIVAVNEENVLSDSHASVVQKIQASGDCVCMLIASNEVVVFCEQNNIEIKKSMTLCQVQDVFTPADSLPTVTTPPASTVEVSTPVPQQHPQQIDVSTPPPKPALSESLSPAPPTPPTPLPFSPQPDQNRVPQPQPDAPSEEDADLALLKQLRAGFGTRRKNDARRNPNRDIRTVFEQANSL